MSFLTANPKPAQIIGISIACLIIGIIGIFILSEVLGEINEKSANERKERQIKERCNKSAKIISDSSRYLESKNSIYSTGLESYQEAYDRCLRDNGIF